MLTRREDDEPISHRAAEIFFEYMSTKIREGELPSQARLDELTAQDARVVSIDGFASPEGRASQAPGSSATTGCRRTGQTRPRPAATTRLPADPADL
jgi:hypothetical protein